MQFGGVLALNALDIAVTRGQVLGLIGPNGSGKTTFFNVVSGIYRPSGGEIRLDGQEITRSTPQQISALGLARTFQRSRLCLPLSVFDNLALGDHRQLEAGLVHNLLRRSRLAREVDERVALAREIVGTFNPSLSGRLFEPAIALGMIDRRRVEICRALMGKPKLLLLDEPSAGMTHDETRQLMDEILEMRERLGDLTIVIIEHEMGVIERVTDHCVVLNYGRKIREGRYRDVATDPVVREAYLGQA